MEKRGQATIFIIVGIVVLAVIGGLFAVRAGYFDVYLNSNRNKVTVSQEIVPVQQYLESCLDDNLILGLDYLSTQGGYLEIEEQLNRFVELGFKECLSDLSQFEEQGYSISYKDLIKSDIKIQNNYID